MKVTAISPDHRLQQYGYKHTRLIEGKLSKNLRNLTKAAIAYYQHHFYYVIKYDYTKLKQFDAVVFTAPPRMNVYVGSRFPTNALTFLLVAQAYQIPVITYPAHQSNTFFYTANKQSTKLSTTTEFSEIVNELGLTEDSSILLVHPENEYDDSFSIAKPKEAIKFFKEFLWK